MKDTNCKIGLISTLCAYQNAGTCLPHYINCIVENGNMEQMHLSTHLTLFCKKYFACMTLILSKTIRDKDKIYQLLDILTPQIHFCLQVICLLTRYQSMPQQPPMFHFFSCQFLWFLREWERGFSSKKKLTILWILKVKWQRLLL